MEEMESKKDIIKKKEKKVGTYTFGAMLIFIGISVIVMTFTKIEVVKYILALWPLFLVGLGIEILYLNSKSDTKVKIDFGSIILMSIVLFFTGIFSLGNYFVNKVLYDNEVKEIFANECVQNRYLDIKKDEKIKINAEDLSNVKVKYRKIDSERQDGYIIVDFKYVINDDTSWVEIFNLNNKTYNEDVLNINLPTIDVKVLPKYIESIDITICTNNIENIEYNGQIIEE